MNAKFSVDTSGADALAGYIDGFASIVSTRSYINSVLDYTIENLSFQFGFSTDNIAKFNPEIYNHVYEWGDYWGDHSTVGSPDDRLWKIVTVGSGNSRTVGFSFLPSTKPSPIHPALLEEGETGKSVNPDVHIFTWKAPVMEYGLTVTIRPELGEALAFFDDADDEIVFTKKTIRAVPGKNGNIGAFTAVFLRWWKGGPAEKMFNKQIKPQIEKDFANRAGITEVLSKYRRKKQVNVKSSVGFADGQRAAKRQFGKKKLEYIARAAERRYDLYGY